MPRDAPARVEPADHERESREIADQHPPVAHAGECHIGERVARASRSGGGSSRPRGARGTMPTPVTRPRPRQRCKGSVQPRPAITFRAPAIAEHWIASSGVTGNSSPVPVGEPGDLAREPETRGPPLVDPGLDPLGRRRRALGPAKTCHSTVEGRQDQAERVGWGPAIAPEPRNRRRRPLVPEGDQGEREPEGPTSSSTLGPVELLSLAPGQRPGPLDR